MLYLSWRCVSNRVGLTILPSYILASMDVICLLIHSCIGERCRCISSCLGATTTVHIAIPHSIINHTALSIDQPIKPGAVCSLSFPANTPFPSALETTNQASTPYLSTIATTKQPSWFSSSIRRVILTDENPAM